MSETKEKAPRPRVQNPDADADTLVFRLEGTPFGTVVYEIIPRSTFGIYQFLRNPAEPAQQIVTVIDDYGFHAAANGLGSLHPYRKTHDLYQALYA